MKRQIFSEKAIGIIADHGLSLAGTVPAAKDSCETRPFGLYYQIDPQLCAGCNLCSQVCPADIIVIEQFQAYVPADKVHECYGCGSCLSVCMEDAIFYR